jgi:alpha-amylase
VGIDSGIYSSPFDAFTNYMNILGDFISRVNSLYPESIDNDQLNSLLTLIKNQGDEIEAKTKEVTRLQTMIEKTENENDKLRTRLDKTAGKISAAKKQAAKKQETAKKEAPKK